MLDNLPEGGSFTIGIGTVAIAMAIGMLIGAGIMFSIDYRTLEKNLVEVNTDMASLQETAMKCYWGSEYQIDPEGTIAHFDGADNTDYYVNQCRKLAIDNWELMSSD